MTKRKIWIGFSEPHAHRPEEIRRFYVEDADTLPDVTADIAELVAEDYLTACDMEDDDDSAN